MQDGYIHPLIMHWNGKCRMKFLSGKASTLVLITFLSQQLIAAPYITTTRAFERNSWTCNSEYCLYAVQS
jgi:hypothetical protein